MRFDYLPLPGSNITVSRPVVDVRMEGIPEVPLSCLIDSGALYNRFDARLAEAAGIDLRDAEGTSEFAVGGQEYTGYFVRVQLELAGFSWSAPVCFIPEWRHDFQLLGQEGFFRWFEVAFFAADEYFTLELARR